MQQAVLPIPLGFRLPNKLLARKQTSLLCFASNESNSFTTEDNSRDPAFKDYTKHSRRNLLTTTLIAGMTGSDGRNSKRMARAVVTIGQENEERKTTSSALAQLKNRISTFTLSNGMRWIVLERHNAPVVACHTYASVGAAVEADGCTGVAHLLEHLAFKGTKLVGTRDAAKETVLLNQLDEAFYTLRDAKREGENGKTAALQQVFKRLQEEAAALVIPNEYGALIAREGGVGLNAQTSQDNTEYFVSLPANKLELWMALESGRFISPVFRELYSEKEVIKEERRLRVENSPYGSFTEGFKEMAFPGHPYRRPVIGYADDFEDIGRREVNSFFRQYYNPKSLTCAVVGDVDPSGVEKLAEKYFGGWKCCEGKNTNNSAKWHLDGGWDQIRKVNSAKLFEKKLPVQPFYMEGYYRPPSSSSDDQALSVINEILSGGRLSRFYQDIILKAKALSATTVDAFPGDQRPSLFLIYGVPSPGSDVNSLAMAIHKELDRLRSYLPEEEEVSWVKKASRAGLLELFGSNLGMAKLLCKYEATTGSWTNLFRENEFIESVSPADVQRVASLLFDPGNCVKGLVTSTL